MMYKLGANELFILNNTLNLQYLIDSILFNKP